METNVGVKEKTLLKKLKLPENATKQEVNERLCVLSRILRAVELDIGPISTWSEISNAYKNFPYEMAASAREIGKDVWAHPLSEKIEVGRRITVDLTELHEDDLYASSDGNWKRCNMQGLLFRQWSHTIWIRPTT